MYAIIQTGGKQYKVQVGDIIEVEKVGVEPGNEVVFDQVLAVAGDDGKLNVGTPVVEGAKVTGTVKAANAAFLWGERWSKTGGFSTEFSSVGSKWHENIAGLVYHNFSSTEK